MTEAQNRPKREYTPKPKPIFDFGDVNHSNGGYTSSMAPPPSRNSGRKSGLMSYVLNSAQYTCEAAGCYFPWLLLCTVLVNHWSLQICQPSQRRFGDVYAIEVSVCAPNVWQLKLVNRLLSQSECLSVLCTPISVSRLTRWPCPPRWPDHQMFLCR